MGANGTQRTYCVYLWICRLHREHKIELTVSVLKLFYKHSLLVESRAFSVFTFLDDSKLTRCEDCLLTELRNGKLYTSYARPLNAM